jgi:hypothetical protein
LDFMYRYFGTYLLQSSFIFLILAQKLGKQADDLILDTCTANLNMLELFNRVTNIDYQKSFANLLRQTINRTMPERQTDIAVATDGGQDCFQNDSSYEDLLRSELSRYRWTEGYRGLWIADSEYPGELMSEHECHLPFGPEQISRSTQGNRSREIPTPSASVLPLVDTGLTSSQCETCSNSPYCLIYRTLFRSNTERCQSDGRP